MKEKNIPEKQQKKNDQTIRTNQNFTNYEASKFAVSTGIENYNEKRKKAIIGVMILGLALLIIRVMMFYPMQIYEKAEDEVNAGMYADKHDTLAWKLLVDENQAAVTHEEMIKYTQDAYTGRIAEIVDNIRTPGKPGYQAAYEKCLSLLPNYGENAQFNSLSWIITGETRTLSYAEADEILYLYSCQCDWDFMENTLDHFKLWLQGESGTDGSTSYTIDFYGKNVDFPGKSGIYLDNSTYLKAKKEALEAAQEERAKELALQVKNNQASFLSVMIPFVKTAFAADMQNWGPEAVAAYNNVMQQYYNSNGKALLDHVIYTNIRPQMQGAISFEIGDVFFEWEGTIEEYEQDDELKAKVEKYNANPMTYRVICLDIGEVLTSDVTEKIGHTHTLEYPNPFYPLWGGQTIYWSYNPPAIDKVTKEYTHYLAIKCHHVIQTVDFTGTADINASNIADVAANGLPYIAQ